jgi:hypothetical protein
MTIIKAFLPDVEGGPKVPGAGAPTLNPEIIQQESELVLTTVFAPTLSPGAISLTAPLVAATSAIYTPGALMPENVTLNEAVAGAPTWGDKTTLTGATRSKWGPYRSAGGDYYLFELSVNTLQAYSSTTLTGTYSAAGSSQTTGLGNDAAHNEIAGAWSYADGEMQFVVIDRYSGGSSGWLCDTHGIRFLPSTDTWSTAAIETAYEVTLSFDFGIDVAYDEAEGRAYFSTIGPSEFVSPTWWRRLSAARWNGSSWDWFNAGKSGPSFESIAAPQGSFSGATRAYAMSGGSSTNDLWALDNGARSGSSENTQQQHLREGPGAVFDGSTFGVDAETPGSIIQRSEGDPAGAPSSKTPSGWSANEYPPNGWLLRVFDGTLYAVAHNPTDGDVSYTALDGASNSWPAATDIDTNVPTFAEARLLAVDADDDGTDDKLWLVYDDGTNTVFREWGEVIAPGVLIPATTVVHEPLGVSVGVDVLSAPFISPTTTIYTPAFSTDAMSVLITQLESPSLSPDADSLSTGGASGPNLYDMARNVGPYAMMCAQLYRLTNDARILEIPRAWYDNAKPHLIDRYGTGFREWERGPNRNMDGLMTHAALFTWWNQLPASDPDKAFWNTYLQVDFPGAFGGTLPTHNLAHPTLARAICEHHLGNASEATAKVEQWLDQDASKTTELTTPARTTRTWRHHTTLTSFEAQRAYYARYTAQYVIELEDLGVMPLGVRREVANAVAHYLLADTNDPIDIAESIIGDDNPVTGFPSTWATRYTNVDWDVWPGYTLLAPYDETGTIAAANTTVAADSTNGAASQAGLVMSEAFVREAWSLVVDPNAVIESNWQPYFDRVINAAQNPSQTYEYLDKVATGDLYEIARWGKQYVTVLAMCLRATGRVEFLTEIQTFMDACQTGLELFDGGPNPGMFRWLLDPGETAFYNLPWHEMDTMMTWGTLALGAEACRVNGDTTRFNYWDGVFDFQEAEWITHQGKHPDQTLNHPTIAVALYYHYRDDATMRDTRLAEFKSSVVTDGQGTWWPHQWNDTTPSPQIGRYYPSETACSILDLAYANVSGFDLPTREQIAASIVNDVFPDVATMTDNDWSIVAYSLFAPWDATQTIRNKASTIVTNQGEDVTTPRRLHGAAAELLWQVLNG